MRAGTICGATNQVRLGKYLKFGLTTEQVLRNVPPQMMEETQYLISHSLPPLTSLIVSTLEELKLSRLIGVSRLPDFVDPEVS